MIERVEVHTLNFNSSSWRNVFHLSCYMSLGGYRLVLRGTVQTTLLHLAESELNVLMHIRIHPASLYDAAHAHASHRQASTVFLMRLYGSYHAHSKPPQCLLVPVILMLTDLLLSLKSMPFWSESCIIFFRYAFWQILEMALFWNLLVCTLWWTVLS